MVDLHQVEPGLPDGHPWKTYSRWQMAWHTFLGVSLVGMIGTLLFALVSAGSGSLSIVETFLPYVFALMLPLICAVLASAFGPWLIRYFPFSQSLLFGGLAVAGVTVVLAVFSVWEWIAQGPCPSDTLCSTPVDDAIWGVLFFGVPMFPVASIGYGLSVWSPTRLGTKVFWPLLGGVAVIFVTVLVFANL